MRYSIGHLMMPSQDDEQFEDEHMAESKAIDESYDDGVWAVWDNVSGEIYSIIYQQVIYEPL